MDDKSTTSSVTKKKPGPKAFDAKAELKEIRDLLDEARRLTAEVRADVEKGQREINNLTACLAKMAHMSGNERVLAEFGIPKWEITKESMRKGGGV